MQATQQNIWFALITLVFTGLYQWAAPLPAWVDIAFLSSCLLFTGIPHGAIDHVIFAQRHQAQPFSLIRQFFLPYLLLIAATALCWILVPNLMFWVFLGIAAYHFGQSQLYYLPPGKAGFPRGLLYMLWGVFLLSWLWTSHWESQIANLQSLFTWDLAINQPLHQTIIVLRWISVSLVALVIAVLCIQRKISVAAAITELIVLAILVYMVRNLPLYSAFALYFGLWHATRVMCTEYSYLRNARQAPFTVRQFLQQFIPFSVLSIIGLIILVIAGSFWNIRVSPFMLFLIFISALTTPHVWVMEHMYGHLSKPAPSNS